MTYRDIIDKLNSGKRLTESEWINALCPSDASDREYAAKTAREIAHQRFGNKVFFRGIIEFTNYCKNDCLYCGIRCKNNNVQRYRLTQEEILACCKSGYAAGFRTFVLQGGEDAFFTDEKITDIISNIRSEFPDCAITLSLGERSRESYELLYKAGANRYLLRHETANPVHYAKLHTEKQSLQNRMRCLYELKEIGYQVGCGMMIGSPYQTVGNLAEDMIFMSEFKPQMIGTGPFIPHHQTPFAAFPAGSTELTLTVLSLCRIMLPNVLLPATTALGSLSEDGRMLGVLAGANVIMPNLSPVINRKKYTLYDNKAITGDDAAESLNILQNHLRQIGYELTVSKGDYKNEKDNL